MQHFGLTVQNMERAYTFYTEVLGGTEVMRDGDFQGERIHSTLLTDQDIEARERHVNPRTLGVPDLRSGAQRLDVRFIQFDNVVLELLQYRDADQPMGGPQSFAEPLDHMSPAFPRMMHICFHTGTTWTSTHSSATWKPRLRGAACHRCAPIASCP